MKGNPLQAQSGSKNNNKRIKWRDSLNPSKVNVTGSNKLKTILIFATFKMMKIVFSSNFYVHRKIWVLKFIIGILKIAVESILANFKLKHL